jgi:hypothetical protein
MACKESGGSVGGGCVVVLGLLVLLGFMEAAALAPAGPIMVSLNDDGDFGVIGGSCSDDAAAELAAEPDDMADTDVDDVSDIGGSTPPAAVPARPAAATPRKILRLGELYDDDVAAVDGNTVVVVVVVLTMREWSEL